MYKKYATLKKRVHFLIKHHNYTSAAISFLKNFIFCSTITGCNFFKKYIRVVT